MRSIGMDGKLKPWHFALFVAAVGALAYSVYSAFSGGPPSLMKSVYLADVQTGELFYAKIRHSLPVPATNPDTKNASLLPVTKVDGKWKLLDRYSASVDLSPVPPDAISADKFVTVKSDSARSIELDGSGKINPAAFASPDGKTSKPSRGD
jgi:hypothetical protein